MIFKWYAEDFGKDEQSVLRYVLKHTSGEQREKLQALLEGQQLTVRCVPPSLSLAWPATNLDTATSTTPGD